MKAGLDYLGKALIPKENPADFKPITHNGKVVIYPRRWYILIAYCLNYFFWLVSTTRHIPLISEHALRYDTTNEATFNAGGPGIDMFGIVSSGGCLLFYLIGGVLVDNYGLTAMTWGAIGMAIGAWGWYVFANSLILVLLSLCVINLAGSIVAVCLLKIATLWFPEHERVRAVATGAVAATIGGGAGLVFGPLFTTGEPLINENLRSCEQDFIETLNRTLLEEGLECNDDAIKAFCCVAETNLDLMNFVLAIIVSVVALFTVVVVEDQPKTAPTNAATVNTGTTFIKALGLMFKHRNYVQICLADFVSSGPPIVIFSTIDRIFPPSLTDLAVYAAAVGVILSIPSAAVFSYFLTKRQQYYEFTRSAYVLGFVAFGFVTILVFFENGVTDVLVLVFSTLAIMLYILWSISVYELKMEYVFDTQFALQANVVAVDRFIINLSLVVFLLMIPPERYKGDVMSGRQFTFLVGAFFMFIGALLAVFIPKEDRDKYNRLQFEKLKENDTKAQQPGQ